MLSGSLHTLVCESALLRDNPLGDPAVREVPVYLPPGFVAEVPGTLRPDGRRAGDPLDPRRVPLVLVLAGFTGVGAGQLKGTPWEPSFPERYEKLLARGAVAPCAFAFPDCFTALGGSQYMNSPATGPYEDHLLEEVVPLVEHTFGVGGRRGRRGVIGKSSGGYGALHLSLQHPDAFSALASHSGDAYFELGYKPDFPKLLALLEQYGSVEAFRAAFEAAPKKTTPLILAMNVLAMAACYSPDGSEPLGIALPFEPRTGRLREDVWARWLTFDPVERAKEYGEVLADFGCVFIDAGRLDEYHLQYGARQLVDALRAKRVSVIHEEFDDGHMGVSYRYESSLPQVTAALSR